MSDRDVFGDNSVEILILEEFNCNFKKTLALFFYCQCTGTIYFFESDRMEQSVIKIAIMAQILCVLTWTKVADRFPTWYGRSIQLQTTVGMAFQYESLIPAETALILSIYPEYQFRRMSESMDRILKTLNPHHQTFGHQIQVLTYVLL